MLLPSIVAFLAPIAIYCWVLAAINRRARPTLVSGTWDCVGMLFAASGILLVVGPVVLNRLFSRLQEAIPLDDPHSASTFALLLHQWQFTWAVYYVLVVGGVLVVLWWRRADSVIYNVDPEMFGHVLQDSLNHLGLKTSRARGRLIILAPTNADVQETNEPEQDQPSSAEVKVDVFPAMCHVSLSWISETGSIRRAVEAQLERRLEGARTFDNPAAGWMLALTGLLLGLILLAGMTLLLIHYFPPRRW